MPSYKDNIQAIADKYTEYQNRVASNDTNAAMWNARQLVELMVDAFISAAGIQLPAEQSDPVEKINVLFRSGVITAETQANYHFIRKTANKVVHSNDVSPADISRSFTLLDTEYQKFQTEYDLDKISAARPPQQKRTVPKAKNRYRESKQSKALSFIILIAVIIGAVYFLHDYFATMKQIDETRDKIEESWAEGEEQLDQAYSDWEQVKDDIMAEQQEILDNMQSLEKPNNSGEDASSNGQSSSDDSETPELDSWMQDALDSWDNLPTDGNRSLKTATLSIGDTRVPQAASVWPLAETKSLDTDVVIVDDTGTVTAVGTGQTKVLLKSTSGSVVCYLYIVE